MSIMQHNGAAIVCMAGKNCVAIASDTRFGLAQQTVAVDFQKVFKQSDRLFVGLAGLAADVQTLRNTLKFKRGRGAGNATPPPPAPSPPFPRPLSPKRKRTRARAGCRSTSCARSA